MLQKFTLLVAIIIGPLAIQNSFAQQSGSVSGAVNDSSGDALQSATVVLFSLPDSTIVDGTITDEEGRFAFRSVSANEYFVRVSFVGFATVDVPSFKLAAGQSYELDAITLEDDAVALAGVAVEAKRDLIEVQPDKTILNVQGTITATGNTALELLRKAPGVVVDNNDNIILAGKNGVKVYIDGKPSPLSVEDLAIQLRTMQSSEIDAIEIITNPGAKYEAEGNAGIINIKLRRDQNLGLNGTIDLSLQQGENTRGSGSTTFNYRDTRFNTYGSYSLNAGDSQNYINLYRIQNNVLYDQASVMNFSGPSNSARLGTDFFVSSKTTIGFLLSGSITDRNWYNTSNTPIIDLEDNELTSTLSAISDNDGIRKNGTANLNIRRDDGEGTTFNIDVDAALFENGTETFQPNRYFVPESTVPETENISRSDAPTDISIYAAKVDYEKPVGGGKLGIGTKVSEVVTDNSYGFFNVIDGENVLDVDRSNDFKFQERIAAGYATFSRKLSVFEVSAGVRAEYTDSKGELTAFKPQDNNTVDRAYLDLFPSGGVVWQANPVNQLRLNYSRRVDRPSYQDLNPFEFKLDELTFRRGNPFLQPQYTNILALTHTYQYVLNTNLTYSYTGDFFAQISDSSGVERSFIMTRNLGSQRTVSGSISYPTNLKPWWSTYTSVTGYNTRNRGNLPGDREVDIQATVASLYHQSSFTLPRNWRFELSGWASSPSIWGAVYRVDSNYSIDTGLAKQLMGGRANLKIAFTDIFKTAPWRGIQDFDGLFIDASGGWESRQLRFNLSYNFGNRQVKKARERQTSTQDEQSRVGGN
ncbi:MAG: TonB-dependent receptor [Rhodothermales bacterium]|nr:TonB-dependent receptor [Rhodothermales bacterium]